MKVKYETNKIYNYAIQIPSKIKQYCGNLSRNIHEKRIEKNFQIHDYTTEGNPAEIIYQMREPIANFARKNNVKIDVYDSRTPVSINGITCYHSEKNAHKNLVVVVTDKKQKLANQNKAVINGDPEAIHFMERIRKYIVNVPGEETQIARQVKSTTEDVMLKHFLRKIDRLVIETVNARGKN